MNMREPVTRPDGGVCPDCETPLANVQGLATCGECGWVPG